MSGWDPERPFTRPGNLMPPLWYLPTMGVITDPGVGGRPSVTAWMVRLPVWSVGDRPSPHPRSPTREGSLARVPRGTHVSSESC